MHLFQRCTKEKTFVSKLHTENRNSQKKVFLKYCPQKCREGLGLPIYEIKSLMNNLYYKKDKVITLCLRGVPMVSRALLLLARALLYSTDRQDDADINKEVTWSRDFIGPSTGEWWQGHCASTISIDRHRQLTVLETTVVSFSG